MVKLSSWTINYNVATFYFLTMSECEEFKQTVDEYVPRIPWRTPEEAHDFPNMRPWQRENMMEGLSGRERALRSLQGLKFLDKKIQSHRFD